MPRQTIDEISQLYLERAQGAYFGEAVSELEHALQAADLASRNGESESLILACLLHDIGHLLHRLPENVADFGIDAKHETIGAAWLARRFDPAITEPIRLHVDAKRYLCATEPSYLQGLSPASMLSLKLQGGVMTPEEAADFEKLPYAQDAIRLRRYDEQAKVTGLRVPAFDAYQLMMTAAIVR